MQFGVNRYQNAQVETASPVRIVVQLHDGAVRLLLQAITLTRSKQIEPRAIALKKAHAIVSELQVSLEAKHSPELCQELERLYDFMLHRISQATVTRDDEKTNAALTPVIKILRELRSAWSAVAEKQK
jgi:flagellar protein FliS